MDWKREAADKLRCYEAKRASAVLAREEMQRLTYEATRIRSAAADGTPVRGGGSTREDVMVDNILRRGELDTAMRIAALWVRTVEAGLAVLDAEERHILDRFYIHRAGGHVERLCEELHLEKSQVYERKDRALRHFTLALYGVVET